MRTLSDTELAILDQFSTRFAKLQDAMGAYEKADGLQADATNDDALLRYNTCVRLIEAHRLTEPTEDRSDYPLE